MTPLVYRALSQLALPAVLARLYWQGRRDESVRADLAERLGRPGLERPPGMVLWLHGASVGEAVSSKSSSSRDGRYVQLAGRS